ncbi:hypothetical protein ASPWEDRAFT_72871 [Aspergillus wentii DTO 134E9]|uniref:Zn(2)-C6 fungal-type domain-containing protein n=1 Tax=Aspergillus wentii DTO 134E9 TaxID=1073089 RepID=A0A1L9R6B1_ASPWE|nr:uncharacterized protein ASPWEDRAFT_72871 [Aspergillus wentii DTO 134E9]KAI9926865.1 hypothetical protein MW887_003963 [Aspergillus wentii]OJJ30465.1 hypothetical protein ASPWEDRAFT_72871 [Aspergillus wentii DTO 134E9]
MADRRKQVNLGQGSKAPTPSVRLSCEMCRQRKVKCDKLSPCTNCQRFGAICVPVERARLPRGRSGRPATGTAERSSDLDADLEDRVSKIEQMLQNLARTNAPEKAPTAPNNIGNQENSHTSLSSESNSPGSTESVKSPKIDAYLGSTFWADLLQQTQDLRQTVNRDTENQPQIPTEAPWQSLVFGSSGHGSDPNLPLDLRTRHQLVHIYLEKVDPVFKIIHRPSLSAFLLDGKPYLSYERGDPAPTALSYALYYTSVCVIEEEKCLLLFGASKELVVPRFQKAAESALVQADFMTTNDLTVLQAYVLTLIASRPQDQSRRVWTMLSMAVRIAQALLLHLPDPAFPVKPFEREMRRRLWHAIGFLDTEASMDRASEPMIQASMLESHPPANVNDSDIWFEMEGPVQESEGFTDMTFTLMTSKAQSASRLLNFSTFGQPAVQSMELRQQVVVDFQQTASSLLEKYQADGVPFHWFTRQVAECINASLQLTSVRPMQRNAKFIPPKVRGDGLLQLAVNVLEKSRALRNDPRSRPWDWVNHIFVPWHGLAVAIAEISVCQDPLLMEKYWPPIQQAYDRLSHLVADSQQGMLWKPIEKFMTQAQARRRQLLGSPTFNAPQIPVSLSDITSTNQPTTFPQPSFQTSLPFTPNLNTQPAQIPYPQGTTPVMTMPEVTNGLGPWPNVWDAMDFSDTGIGNATETSWLNYESFIEDLYENADYLLRPRYQLGYGNPP